jgi:hypothetical protein
MLPDEFSCDELGINSDWCWLGFALQPQGTEQLLQLRGHLCCLLRSCVGRCELDHPLHPRQSTRQELFESVELNQVAHHQRIKGLAAVEMIRNALRHYAN